MKPNLFPHFVEYSLDIFKKKTKVLDSSNIFKKLAKIEGLRREICIMIRTKQG